MRPETHFARSAVAGWKMRKTVAALLPLLLVGALAAGCKDDKKAGAMPPPEVLVTEVKQQDVPIYREWVATTDGFINAQIRAKVSGYLLSRHYKEGSVVKSGQLLFQIDPRQFQASLDQALGDLARNQAALVKSEQDVARYTPLAAEGAVSQKELDDAVQSMRANQAMVASAQAAVEQARLNLGWTKVTSPIDGVAGIAIAQVGDLIQQSSQLTTVSQLDPIKVYFPISEQEYLTYARRINTDEAAGKSGNPDLEITLADGSVYPRKGAVDVANRQVDVRTGTIQLQALFPNPDNLLRPGQFARVRAPIKVEKNAMIVPQRAVADVQGQLQVAVIGADNKVEVVNVEAGEKVGENWLIKSGLKPGDRIVAEGLQKVRAGAVVNPKPFVAPAATPMAAQPPKSS